MFLQFEARWYDVAMNKLHGNTGDPSESACAAALEYIRTKNYAQFKNIWEIPPKPAASANDPSSGVQVGDSNAWLDGYRSAFDFDHVAMVAKILVGSHSVCVWDANAKSGPVRRAFIVRADRHGVKVSAVTSDTKLEEVILNSMEAARRAPSDYKPVFEFHPRLQFAIPSEDKGIAGEHPVFLQFDGVATDFDMAQKTPLHTADSLIEFYQRAYLANSGPSSDVLAAMFTSRSAADLKKWKDKEQEKDDKQLAVHAEQAFLAPRYVKFVIHGDPVSLVFVSSEAGKAWKPELLSYRYIVKDPSSEQLQFANLGYANALDQLLYSKLFDMRILRAPQSNAKPTAAPAKTKTGK